MIKIGIMELMICTVFPVITRRPMVMITQTTATIIGERIRTILRKKIHMRTKMTAMATGADKAICLNISTPKTSSATGKPVI